ncbi:MAG: DNA polymerase III subunit gamma/tau [Lachnospiraceae bacterium]|nr:DNA polymerase III subunit gamma/tau [Lachnospiraceae bacterium]
MSYTALYRKFRPQEFEDVKGQEHIVTTLKNQLKADRIGHAYLFCGTRGTGKTTVAKIFAKAVNCEHPVDGSPCGTCEACRTIAAGTSMNVVEIDAASNNGVENVRQIREEVEYAPTEGKYKVYIIDEVHMLSIGAFNALLKTLEEPPSYVIFILATTEVHKIPITILSRCQRYDFHRISIETIAKRLFELLREEGVEAEEKAIRYVAKTADGSMRDALSLLDQCIAFYLGEKLTYDRVLEVLGAVDIEVFGTLFREILGGDVLGTIKFIEEIVIQGRELGQFVTDFIWYLRNLLLAQNSDEMEDVLDISSENFALLKEEAQMIETEILIRYIRIFSELSNRIKYSSQKRVLIEIALIKLCRPQMEKDESSILDRIHQIEKQLEQGITVISAQKEMGEPNRVSSVEEPPKKKKEYPKAIPEDVREVARNWSNILQELPGLMKTYLKLAKPSLSGDNVLLIILEDEMAVSYLNDEERKKEIETVIEQRIGSHVEVQIQLNETNRPFEESYVDLRDVIHMDITIEDELE